MTDSDIVTWLRSILHNDRSVELRCKEAANEIEQLRKERDEARRDVCDMMHMTGFLAGDYAASRGWDCFPDMKCNVSEEVKNFILIIERDYDAVVAERDEAMKLVQNIADEVSRLSTKPAAIIKFSDLVYHINEWGDTAIKILSNKENTNVQ